MKLGRYVEEFDSVVVKWKSDDGMGYKFIKIVNENPNFNVRNWKDIDGEVDSTGDWWWPQDNFVSDACGCKILSMEAFWYKNTGAKTLYH